MPVSSGNASTTSASTGAPRPGYVRTRSSSAARWRSRSGSSPTRFRRPTELGLPPIYNQLVELPQGLVIVTGPTGAGKTTTLAAVIDSINSRRAAHVITVEEPIEFLHRHKRSLVNQREVGVDCIVVRERAARRTSGRPRRAARGRDPRPRDDLDRADDGRDWSPRVRDHAHQRCCAVGRPHRRRVPRRESEPDPRHNSRARSPACCHSVCSPASAEVGWQRSKC